MKLNLNVIAYNMNVNFYLYDKNKPAGTPRSIYLVCYCKTKQLRWNTSIRVSETQWDAVKMRVKNHTDRNVLNGKLAELADIAREYEDKMPLSEKPSQQAFNNFFWVRLKMKEEGKSFFVIVEEVLADLPQRENRNHEIVGEKTMGKYRTVAKALRMFEAEKKKTNKGFALDFKTFNEKILKEFEFFLSDGKYKADTKKGVQPNARNTVVRQMEILFAFFTAAQKKGIEVCTDYQDYDNSKEKVVNVTITKDEFEQIYAHKGSNDRLENVRQLFVIACTTGFRYSDICSLTMNNINIQEGMIQKIQQKTNGSVNVALHPLLRKMLEDNNWSLPAAICNQDFNRYIKELFKEIGLDRTIQISRIVGKKRLVSNYKLYEVASSKMGRRYLCSSLAGMVPDRTIMAMSGHRSVSAFHSYLCNTQEQEREAVSEIWENQYGSLLAKDLPLDEAKFVERFFKDNK